MQESWKRPQGGRVPVPALVVSASSYWNEEVKTVLEASRQFFVPHTGAQPLPPDAPAIVRGIVVIDAMFAAERGFEPVREARKAAPGCSILLVGYNGLTEAEETDLVAAGLEAGATGFARDYRPANQLLMAAVAVLNGDIVVVHHRPDPAREGNMLRWPEHQVPFVAAQARS